MLKEKLTNIKLGAPSSIEGGASPDAQLTVSLMENCENLKLKDQVLGKCTRYGAMKTGAGLLKQYYDECNFIPE